MSSRLTLALFIWLCCMTSMSLAVLVTRMVKPGRDVFSSSACNATICNSKSSSCYGGNCCTCMCYHGKTYSSEVSSCQIKSAITTSPVCSFAFGSSQTVLETIQFNELAAGKRFYHCPTQGNLLNCLGSARQCRINKSGSYYENNGWKPLWENDETVDINVTRSGRTDGIVKFGGSQCSNEKYKGILVRLSVTCVVVDTRDGTFKQKELTSCLWAVISGTFNVGVSKLSDRVSCGIKGSPLPPTTDPTSIQPSPSTVSSTAIVSPLSSVNVPTMPPGATTDDPSDLSSGVIIAIAASAVVLLFVGMCVLWVCFGASKRRRRHNRSVILHPNESHIGYSTNLSEVNKGFRSKNLSRLFTPHVNEMFVVQGKARRASGPIYDNPCDEEDNAPHDLQQMYATVDKRSKYSSFNSRDDSSSSPQSLSSSLYYEPGAVITSVPHADQSYPQPDEVYDEPETIHPTLVANHACKPPVPAREDLGDYALPDDAFPASIRNIGYKDDSHYDEPETQG